MDPARVIEFARSNHRAVLQTFRADGTVQLSPILVATDGEVLLVSTRETAAKTKNLDRDPRAAVCLLNDGFFGPWHVAWGTAEIVRLPEAMEQLVDYYRLVAGEHDDWDDYRAAMTKERRVMLRVSVDRAGPDVSG